MTALEQLAGDDVAPTVRVQPMAQAVLLEPEVAPVQHLVRRHLDIVSVHWHPLRPCRARHHRGRTADAKRDSRAALG